MTASLETRVLVSAMSVYFLCALLTGVWKYRWMMRAPGHQAPVYVDIAHRASLQYSFACLVLMVLAQWCVWPQTLRLAAIAALLLFFTSAIATYIALGFINRTDNQFRRRTLTTTLGMWLLIAGEVGGFAVLASGALVGVWR